MSKKIIVVDDNAPLRQSLCRILESADYDVRTSEHGTEGLVLQRSHPADLIISDLCMPRKSGIQIIDELKPEFPGLHIIAVSGGPGPKRKPASRFTNTCSKPFETSALTVP